MIVEKGFYFIFFLSFSGRGDVLYVGCVPIEGCLFPLFTEHFFERALKSICILMYLLFEGIVKMMPYLSGNGLF